MVLGHLWRHRDLRDLVPAGVVGMSASGVLVAAQYSLVGALGWLLLAVLAITQRATPTRLQGRQLSVAGAVVAGAVVAGATAAWLSRRPERWAV